MKLVSAWKAVVLGNYTNFSGRARRSEFWWFFLANWLLIMATAIGFAILGGIVGVANSDLGSVVGGVGVLAYLAVVLGTLLPTIAVSVRRLHDIGQSGWLYLLVLVPCVSLVLIVLFCLDSQRAPNKYGASPKYPG